MLLAIDVGNSNIVLGVFQEGRLVESWRLSTLRDRTADELGIWVTHLLQHRQIDPRGIAGMVMASVVPPLTSTLRQMAERYFSLTPLTVDHKCDTGMPILYKPPSDVGADRIVNSIAAYEKYGRAAGVPVIVVDFGTATTFDAISSKGEYLGGVICPGIQISADALFQRAARLPRIDVRRPSQVIGTTTVGAMESGLLYGYVGLVEGLVKRMRGELGPNTACVATGGFAGVIAPETAAIEQIDLDLTLHGLRMVWDRTQGGRHGQ